MEDAIDQVRRGQAWGAIILYENFTENTIQRLQDTIGGTIPAASVIDNSTIHMYLDVTGMSCNLTYEVASCTGIGYHFFIICYSLSYI